MINLAGVNNCDETISEELKKAGIDIIQKKSTGEVPFNIAGKLGNFTFGRAWYYWVVYGNVPLDIADELYNNKIGKKDIRIAGHCGCPSPKQWAFPKDELLTETLNNIGIDLTTDGITYGKLAELCNSGKINLPRFVRNYHIDSQEGLNLFVKTIKKYGLIK